MLRVSVCSLLAIGGVPAVWAATPAASTPAAVHPGAPAIVSAVAGANSVRLQFTPPAAAGSSPVVLYTATCSEGKFRFVGTAAGSPVAVSGLTQAISYQCTVSAANGQLTGPESQPFPIRLPGATPITVLPSAPQNVSITPGNGRLVIQFQPPASDGAFTVVGYQASCTGGNGVGGSALASPIIVNGLKNAAPYTCTVAAVNTQGTGADTPALTATPQAGVAGPTAPAAPSNVLATPGNGMASIAFAAPASNGGAPITAYSATCSAGGQAVSASALGSPIQVFGLANGSTYGCSLTAASAYGNSAAVTTTVTPSASLANPVAAPASLTLSATVPSLAADGTTAVVAQLRTANGALYSGPDVPVTFGSLCVGAGTASMDTTAMARNGVASVIYQPNGCTGADTLNAAIQGSSSVKGSATVVVSDVPALSGKAALEVRFAQKETEDG